jgi:hypothetical protein
MRWHGNDKLDAVSDVTTRPRLRKIVPDAKGLGDQETEINKKVAASQMKSLLTSTSDSCPRPKMALSLNEKFDYDLAINLPDKSMTNELDYVVENVSAVLHFNLLETYRCW